MYAEALNEYNNGPTADAINVLKMVRERGYEDDSKIGTIPSTYADFRNAIINERKLELGFESFRRTDLVRWGILFESLTQTKQNVTDMANKTGKYSDIDLYWAYKKVAATSFEDPIVSVPYIGYKQKPSAAEEAQLVADGYTILEMHSSNSLSYAQKLDASATWLVGLFRGLEKNKVELLPFNTTEIIDVNPGLQGEQHPLY
jgi:hypothetical protein